MKTFMKAIQLILASFVVLFSFSQATKAQLVVDAGGNKHFCTHPDSLNLLTIGGEPTVVGGTPPYTYEWSIEPFEFTPGSNITILTSHVLDDSTLANPIITDFLVRDTLFFTLKVTDGVGEVAYDNCIISFSTFVKNTAYFAYTITEGDSVFLDKGQNIDSYNGYDIVSYQWVPEEGLSSSTLPNNFWAFPDTETVYSVKITDVYGCEAQGDPYYFITPTTAGMNVFDFTSNVNIYPNPASQIMYIKTINGDLINEVKIYDLNGKIKLQQYENYGVISEVDVKVLPSGLYFISLRTKKGEIYNMKIAIN